MTITSAIAAVPFSKKELLENFHKVHPIAQLSYCPETFLLEPNDSKNPFLIKLSRANSNFNFYYPKSYKSQTSTPGLTSLAATLPSNSTPTPVFAKKFMALAKNPEMKAFLDDCALGAGFVNYMDSMARFPNKSCVVLLTKTIEDFIKTSCGKVFEQFDNLLNGKMYVSAKRNSKAPQLDIFLTIGLVGNYKRLGLTLTPQLTLDGNLHLLVSVTDLLIDNQLFPQDIGKEFLTALLSQLADHVKLSTNFTMYDWF